MSIEFTNPECGEQNNVEPEIAGRRGNCSFCGAAVIVPQASGVATPAPPQAAPRKSRTLWIVLAVVVVCLGLVAYQLALTAVRRDLYRLECTNNIKQISLALSCYEDQYGFFPPGGGGEDPARMSWRVAILPMINEAHFISDMIRSNRGTAPRTSNSSNRCRACFAAASTAMPLTRRRAM